ncbi:hypothetical protein [Butyrivibrio sp. JL13D10]|uniref:hypothetical protein n=1 Tax=Butyrivibrio sp. JL13D10 TaxID=3236815 RepID=UPI0038B668C9
MKNKGISIAKKFIASVLAAAFIVGAAPTTNISVKAAAKVDISETVQALNKRGALIYKETGNSMITITPGTYAKNVLTVAINDEDAKIKNIKCNKKLRYKRTFKKYDDENGKVVYRFSFYTQKSKLYNFKFTVDGQEYRALINATTPVEKATFAGKELSTKIGLGTQNYITDLKNGKINVKMSKNYALESIQIGKYRNNGSGNKVEPVLYWTPSKNNKKVNLSGEKQVTVAENGDVTEESMYSTTIIRINYKYLKNNTTGSVDYYLNRIVDYDN